MEKWKIDNCNAMAPFAVKSEKETGFPAELSLAQWALESGWGKSVPKNNPFGIKARWGLETQEFQTREVFTTRQLYDFKRSRGESKVLSAVPNGKGQFDCVVLDLFAVYPSVEAAFADHSKLIRLGRSYAAMWNDYLKDKDVDKLAYRLEGVYATDDRYYESLHSLMNGKVIKDALAKARAEV